MTTFRSISLLLGAALALTSCEKTKTAIAETSAEPPCSHCTASKPGIFNGKNLDGWSAVLVDKSLSKEDVWSVEDGILICKGNPLGYLHTDASYQDFHFTFEWRWAPGTEPTNSGVLLRIAAPPETFLPKCVEAQLQHEKAGDLYAFFGATLDGDPERFKTIETQKIGTLRSLPRLKTAEKPAGEWNHYDITVKGDTVTLKINGELVNEGKGIDVIAGPIGLQSEGSEIHFRNIALTEL